MLRSQTRTHLLFLAPSLLLIFVFIVIPALFALYISFTNMALTGVNALNYRLIGPRNYVKLITDENFLPSPPSPKKSPACICIGPKRLRWNISMRRSTGAAKH